MHRTITVTAHLAFDSKHINLVRKKTTLIVAPPVRKTSYWHNTSAPNPLPKKTRRNLSSEYTVE